MRDFSQIVLERDYWTLTKLWHAVDALYMWEYFTTFDYEWSVIRGHRPYRWTIWIYSLTRVATLLAAILNLIGLDATIPINCQAWVTFNFIFGYVAIASSSLLVVFRVIAIWRKNVIVVALAFTVWGANVSCLSQGIIRIRARWESVKSVCVVLNIETNKPTMIVILVTDILLHLIMLFGLLNLRRGGDASKLGRWLWRQGIAWLLIGTFVEFMPVLFISLFLSDAVNIMFLMPALLMMSITSTRMYRSLSDFISSIDIDKAHDSDSLPRTNCRAPSIKLSPFVPALPNRAEVKANVSRYKGQYIIPQPYPCFSFDSDNEGRGRLYGSTTMEI